MKRFTSLLLVLILLLGVVVGCSPKEEAPPADSPGAEDPLMKSQMMKSQTKLLS